MTILRYMIQIALRKLLELPAMVCATILALLMCSCTQEEAFPTHENLSDGLYLDITTTGNQQIVQASRADDTQDPLRESAVSTLDVFFIDNSSSQVTYYSHVTDITSGQAQVITGEWKSKFTGNSYDVFVLANYKGDTDLKGITTRTALQSLQVKDTDVLRAEGEKYGATETTSTYTDKLFTMSGSKKTWNPQTAEDQAVISVQLTRHAAKMILNIKYESGFTNDVSRLADLSKTLVNFAVTATPFGTNQPAQASLAGEPALEGNTYQSRSNVVNGEGTTRTETLYFYSYPNDWSGNLQRETYVLVNIPFYAKSAPSDLVNNYYKIPLKLAGSESGLKLDGNTVYTYDITVNRVGSKEIDAPVELEITNSSWQVWVVKTVDFGPEKPTYLIPSAELIEMYPSNKSRTVSFTFTSGSAVDEINLNEAFYVNKTLGRVDNLGGIKLSNRYSQKIEYDNETHRSGKVTVTIAASSTGSVLPENLASHHYEIKLKNANGIEKIVRVSVRPELYITPLRGVVGTRSDFKSQYPIIGANYVSVSPPSFSSSNKYESTREANFFAKMYYWNWNAKISYIQWVGSGNNWALVGASTSSGQMNGNPYMYLVVMSQVPASIASYPDMVNYGIGRVNADASSGERLASNSLISPMFLVASELGTTLDMTASQARDHASKYREVVSSNFIYTANDKKSDYLNLDGWRLPTKGEVALIAKLQNFTGQDVIEQTFQYKENGGRAYYTLYSEDQKGWFFVHTNTSLEQATGSEGTPSVRCVRDVSQEEIEDWKQAGYIQ